MVRVRDTRASGTREQVATIIRDRPEGFAVMAGDDAWALAVLAMGGDGVVSVASNVIPGLQQFGSLIGLGPMGFHTVPVMAAAALKPCVTTLKVNAATTIKTIRCQPQRII